MGIPCYLAMTAAEMAKKSDFPEDPAWMACHFSPYGTGLSNLPRHLPDGAVLTVNDITPIHGHDPDRIWEELAHCAQRFQCRAVVLDFQRGENPETKALVSALCTLPCHLVIAEAYAREDKAVLLPPVPLSTPLEDCLAPWTDREIWLEPALDGEIITLTEQGATCTPLPYPDPAGTGFREETLHCHYRTRVTDSCAEFTLWRTAEDLYDLTEEAERLGVTALMGLYQELHWMNKL